MKLTSSSIQSQFWMVAGGCAAAIVVAALFALLNANASLEALEQLRPAADAAGGAAGAEAVAQGIRSSQYLGFVVVGLTVGASFALLAWFSARQVIAPAQRVNDLIERFAQGDFSSAGDSASSRLGALGKSLTSLQTRLAGLVGEVNNSATELSEAAGEMNRITGMTREGTRRQESETEQVATAMNQMSATVQEVARNAMKAADAALEADEAADNGKVVVSETAGAIDALQSEIDKAVAVIRKLDENSQTIGSVLDVIRGIAEQTNLLALNAAIEAARAGEQGRGFAVVADEVRTLAQRTQQSTQEIHDMIERLQSGASDAVAAMDSSRARAETVFERSERSAEALVAIAAAVSTIKDMNAQIATAAQQQSAVAEEINHNIESIKQIAEESAAGVDRTAEHGARLGTIAQALHDSVADLRH